MTDCIIKYMHGHVSAAKKTKDARHTSVLFTGTAKLLNCQIQPSISPKLLNDFYQLFMPIHMHYFTYQIEGNRFNIS